MNKILVLAAAALSLTLPATVAQAQSGNGPETIFQCTLRNGKTVSVTAQAGNLFYRYGQGNRAELSLRGSARSGTVFFMRQRYAGPQSQLRFTRGQHSYIVHAMEGNGRTGARPVSGLVVMRGDRVIANHSCRRYSEFTSGFDILGRLPEDSERYSAM